MINKTIHILIICLIFIGCSEGDVLQNDIANFTASLEHCSNSDKNTFVFYKINPDANQSLSFGFTSTTFELTTAPEELQLTIDLNTSTNTLIYREFGATINGASYFCASVPPAGINITRELISTSGNAEVIYKNIKETDTDITYSRTITLKDITFNGDGISIRQELLELGNDEFTIAK